MLTKKLCYFILLIFIPTTLISQVRIGDFNFSKYKFNKLDQKSLKRFTSTKTTFILPDFLPKASYQDILKKVWDVTPYEIIYKNDFTDDTIKTDDVLAMYKSIEVEKTTKSGRVISYNFNLIDFHIVDKIKFNKKKKKNTWESSRVGAIYFTPDIKMRQNIVTLSGDREVKGNLLNYRLGYLKNYLQLVNKNLKNNTSIDIYDDLIAPELKNLKDQTLYIDSNLLYGYDPYAVSEKKGPEIEKLTNDYPFNYQVVDYHKLEDKIFNSDIDFYYLMYNQINANKIINIINGKTGDVIYQKHTTMSYNIKPKDFKAITGKIQKLNK